MFSDTVAKEWDLKGKYIDRIDGEDNLVRGLILEEVKRLDRAIRVLDVGCGSGKLLDEMSALDPSNVYEGIDASADMIAIAGRRNWRAANPPRLTTSRLEEYSSPEPYDLIVLKQVLHHVLSPVRALTTVHDLLARDGRCIVMVPNPLHQSESVRFSEEDDPLGRMSEAMVERAAETAGLRIIRRADSSATAEFSNLLEYFRHMQSIGSLQKMFAYRPDTAIFRNFLEQFADQLRITPRVRTVLGYSYYLMERND